MAPPSPGLSSPAARADWSPLPKPDQVSPSGALIWHLPSGVQVSATRVHADLWQVLVRRDGRTRLRLVGAADVAGLLASAAAGSVTAAA